MRKKSQSGLLKAPLPLLNDPEGEYLPAGLPFTVDAHVHLPYAWDREIRALIELNLPDAVLEKILGKNAMEFYSIA